MTAEHAGGMDATVLLVGKGIMVDALARRLPREGIELERASTAAASATAHVAAPDLIVLAGDSANDGGNRVLDQLARDKSTAELPVLVICGPQLATFGGRRLRAHSATLAPEGGLEICAERIQALLSKLSQRGADRRPLQQVVDELAGGPRPVAPVAAKAPPTSRVAPPPAGGLTAPRSPVAAPRPRKLTPFAGVAPPPANALCAGQGEGELRTEVASVGAGASTGAGATGAHEDVVASETVAESVTGGVAVAVTEAVAGTEAVAVAETETETETGAVAETGAETGAETLDAAEAEAVAPAVSETESESVPPVRIAVQPVPEVLRAAEATPPQRAAAPPPLRVSRRDATLIGIAAPVAAPAASFERPSAEEAHEVDSVLTAALGAALAPPLPRAAPAPVVAAVQLEPDSDMHTPLAWPTSAAPPASEPAGARSSLPAQRTYPVYTAVGATLLSAVTAATLVIVLGRPASTPPSAAAGAMTLAEPAPAVRRLRSMAPASSALASEDADEAELADEFRPELQARVDAANARVAQGHRLLKGGHLGLAEAQYMKALGVLPGYPRALAGLTRVHLRRKDGAEAVRWAKRLVARQPRRGNNQLLLGDALALRGDRRQARAAWERAKLFGNPIARKRLR